MKNDVEIAFLRNLDLVGISQVKKHMHINTIKSMLTFYLSTFQLLPWSQRLSFILYWQILRRESLLEFFFIGKKRWEPRKESLWSRPLGTSLSCHQLLTVDSDWRTFLITLWVIWLDGLNIFGDGSGVYMFTFMGMGGELLLYQRILLPCREG